MTNLKECSLPRRAGLGLKPQHCDAILRERPDVGFFEVHAENYMGEGGAPHRALTAISSRYPLSLHGVGLSIGAARPLDRRHLARLGALIERYRPQSFSEHLAWSTHADGFLNDLLPLPYTMETLERVIAHVDQTQAATGFRLLLENPATYILFEDSTIDEIDFLDRIATRTGCGLLLDVNNVMVSSVNHGRDPFDYIACFPMQHVGEIHLAGYDETADPEGGRLLLDAHGSAVREDVFELYLATIRRTGPLPTLVEWDNDVPELAVLLEEGRRVEAALRREASSAAPALEPA